MLGPDHGAVSVVLDACAGPIKALVQERRADWQDRFGRVLGLKVVQLTGDDDTEGLDELETADIICTTPEKFGGWLLGLVADMPTFDFDHCPPAGSQNG